MCGCLEVYLTPPFWLSYSGMFKCIVLLNSVNFSWKISVDSSKDWQHQNCYLYEGNCWNAQGLWLFILYFKLTHLGRLYTREMWSFFKKRLLRKCWRKPGSRLSAPVHPKGCSQNSQVYSQQNLSDTFLLSWLCALVTVMMEHPWTVPNKTVQNLFVWGWI